MNYRTGPSAQFYADGYADGLAGKRKRRVPYQFKLSYTMGYYDGRRSAAQQTQVDQ